jgi:hypothetical protein
MLPKSICSRINYNRLQEARRSYYEWLVAACFASPLQCSTGRLASRPFHSRHRPTISGPRRVVLDSAGQRMSDVSLLVSTTEVITSALKMGTACFSETLPSTNQSLRRLNPKEHHKNCHRCENLKSHHLSLSNSVNTLYYNPISRHKGCNSYVFGIYFIKWKYSLV